MWDQRLEKKFLASEASGFTLFSYVWFRYIPNNHCIAEKKISLRDRKCHFFPETQNHKPCESVSNFFLNSQPHFFLTFNGTFFTRLNLLFKAPPSPSWRCDYMHQECNYMGGGRKSWKKLFNAMTLLNVSIFWRAWRTFRSRKGWLAYSDSE